MRARTLAAAAAVFALLPALALGAGKRVTIAFTNDFESAYDPVESWWRDDMARIGGIAELATLVDTLRDTSETFFLFDAGDIFTGTLAQRTQGAVSFDLMSLMGYDAMVIGNHEFEYGWEVLADQKNRVAFPVLGANLFYRGTDHPFAQPWAIIERDGVRVGVIGVMGQDAGTALIPAHIAGLDVRDPAAVIAPIVKRLRAQCDLVVVLAHQGMTAPMQTNDEADTTVQRGNDANLALARAVPGIDAVLAGHTDAGTREPLVDPVHGTVVMQTFGQGQHLGVLEFNVSDSDVRFIGGRLEPVNADRLPPNAAVRARLAEYRSRHADLYEPIGQTAAPLTRRYYAESTLGNALADIVREAVGAQVGLMPSGALRRDLPQGAVRRVDLLDAFPFQDRVARVELTGDVLARVLEQGLSLERGLLQVSGLEIDYNPARPAGARLVSVLVNGAPLDPEGLYTVGTLEILAAGGDQFTQFSDATSNELLALSFADALLRAFETSKLVSPPELGRYTAVPD
ncbi:MAG: bifunctional UDP-sugar hydrolase/5'-nucleotidase [Pseudomonadota bacterium]